MTNWPSITHANLVETYLKLAQAIPGTETVQSQNWTACRNPMDYASCNFGIITSAETMESPELENFIGNRNSFHIYSFCNDFVKDSVDGWATRMGYRHGSILIALAMQPKEAEVAPTVKLEFAVSESERSQIAEAIALQFFPRQTRAARLVIVAATAGSGLPLAKIVFEGEVVGAVMLCRTNGAIGLYNFFVEQRFRGRGIGKQTMLAVAELARIEQCILCLQCDLSLYDWYERMGFNEIGHVDICVLDRFGTVAIIG